MTSFVANENNKNPWQALLDAAWQLKEDLGQVVTSGQLTDLIAHDDIHNESEPKSLGLSITYHTLYYLTSRGRYPRQNETSEGKKCHQPEDLGNALQEILARTETDHSLRIGISHKFADHIEQARKAGLFDSQKIAQLSGQVRGAA